MNEPVLVVDVDDVLFPYVIELAAYYNQLKGAHLTVDDFHSYKFTDVYGGTEDESTRIAHAIHAADLSTVQPLPGSVAALQRLARHFDIHIVTSRPPQFRGATESWLNRHFAGLFTSLELVGNHYDGTRRRTKAAACVDLGARFLIDDQLHYAAECSARGISVLLFGMYAWNATDRLPSGVTRCADWTEVEAYLARER